MIGKKKLNDIRAGVAKAFADAGLDPVLWADKQIDKEEGRVQPNTAEIETLKLVRDGLRAAASRKRRARTRSK